MNSSNDLHQVHLSHALSGWYSRNSSRRPSAESADVVLFDPTVSFYDGFYYPQAITDSLELNDLDTPTAPNSPTRYENPDWASQTGLFPAFERRFEEYTQEYERHDEGMNKRKADEILQLPTSEEVPQTPTLHAPQTPCELSGYNFQSEGISRAESRSKTAGNGNEGAREHDNDYSLCSRPGSRGRVRKWNRSFGNLRRSARIRGRDSARIERATRGLREPGN
ncbi:hypothetical protein HIM_11428 [Hirsutella minnesotensis 3608]|uniref:Uncharacterized protein n=1 Tax=Hirsutella minnesotensis 3608 TaxID=1043627 RepID=A0A0F7ZJ26_9HYPO|nr:hypothetical protein HIM_11428 [Hirsutella minnesotensis 3608]